MNGVTAKAVSKPLPTGTKSRAFPRHSSSLFSDIIFLLFDSTLFYRLRLKMNLFSHFITFLGANENIESWKSCPILFHLGTRTGTRRAVSLFLISSNNSSTECQSSNQSFHPTISNNKVGMWNLEHSEEHFTKASRSWVGCVHLEPLGRCGVWGDVGRFWVW